MSLLREHVIKPLTRSSGWRKARKAHLKKHPRCAACGRENKLEVHHIVDFSTQPGLELERRNLITLCDGGTHCHFVFGHLGNWRSINPFILKDAQWFRYRVRRRR